jgi:hypothetical protein
MVAPEKKFVEIIRSGIVTAHTSPPTRYPIRNAALVPRSAEKNTGKMAFPISPPTTAKNGTMPINEKPGGYREGCETPNTERS